MDNKNLVTLGVIVVVLSLALAGLSQLSKLSDGVSGLVSAVSSIVKGGKLGAVSGPDLYAPYFAVNGVTEYSFNTPLLQASTTVCAFKTPAATTTLEYASLNIAQGTSTAVSWSISRSALPSATSSSLSSNRDVEANFQDVLVASTTYPVFAPSTYLNFTYADGKLHAATTSQSAVNGFIGACKAKFWVN